MNSEKSIADHIRRQKILPLFYHNDVKVAVEVVRTLYSSGIRVIEFTNRGEKALHNFKAIIADRDEKMNDLLLGAGTIRTAEQALKFIEAGADFLISPVFDQDICNTAVLCKKLWIPGCMTPTEIHFAELAGCRLIKLFPANLLRPSFVLSIKELFPETDFIPTGGIEVDRENLESWFKAGVCAVGVGSKLLSKSLMDLKNYAGIENETRQLLELIQSIAK